MPAANLNLTFEQGVDYSKVFTVTDAAGAVYPMTGYNAYFTIKKYKFSTETILEATTLNGKLSINTVLGTIFLQLTSSDTALINTTSCVYQLKIVGPTGKVIRVLEGVISCSLSI